MPLYVIFRVGSAEYALPACDVLQMESYSGATRVPGAAEYVAGVVHARGRAVPVIDLRKRFGLPPAEPTLDARVLVVRHGERELALLTERAREVVAIADDAFTPAPPVVANRSAQFVLATARAGERLVMLLDVERVLSGERNYDEQRQYEP